MSKKPVRVKSVKIGGDYVRINFWCKPNVWTGADEDHVTHYAPAGTYLMSNQMIEDLFMTALAEAADMS